MPENTPENRRQCLALVSCGIGYEKAALMSCLPIQVAKKLYFDYWMEKRIELDARRDWDLAHDGK